jgi:catechol 2,3-dioxygenase-like lactoylglutathione lyase family enzyme
MEKRLGKISHIELYVSNLASSLSFWSWFLEYVGYTKYQEFSTGESWMRDGEYIVFVQAENLEEYSSYHRRGVGLNHIAFQADTKEQIDILTQELRKRGIAILYADKHPYAGGASMYAVYFEDPDRIKVEVCFVE